MHENHRERMREKFRKNPSVLEDHELLELLLFYAIPRRNTNVEAHSLISSFHSLRNVFDAGIPALTLVDGIGENTALYLKVIAEVVARYTKQGENLPKNLLDCEAELEEHIKNLFIGTDNERIYLLLFKNNGELIHEKMLAEGYASEVDFPIRDVVATALASNATVALLVHNHPHGEVTASSDDFRTTDYISNVLKDYNIDLEGHYIVAGDECQEIISARQNGLYESDLMRSYFDKFGIEDDD